MTNNTLLIIFNSAEFLGRFLPYLFTLKQRYLFPVITLRIVFMCSELIIAANEVNLYIHVRVCNLTFSSLG